MSTAASVTDITSKAQFNELVKNDSRVAVQAHANWCGPCKAISPIFSKLSGETAGVAFARFNTDDVADLTQELGIRSIPAFFKDGSKENTVAGSSPKALTDAVAAISQ